MTDDELLKEAAVHVRAERESTWEALTFGKLGARDRDALRARGADDLDAARSFAAGT